MDQGPRLRHALSALSLTVLLAACGADGEPEQPTRNVVADPVPIPAAQLSEN